MSHRIPSIRGRHLGRRAASSALLALMAMLPSAFAQSADADDFPNLIAMGIGLTPDYSGASSRGLAAFPIFNYDFKNSERAITVLGPVASFNMIDHRSFNAGPVLRYKPGRSNVGDQVIAQLHEIDATVDTGAFISYRWIGSPEMPWRLRVWASAYKSVGNGGGTSSSISGHFMMPLSRRALVVLGGSLSHLSADTMKADFGVTEADSFRSGLPAFHPGGGKSSEDLWLGATFLVTKKWAVGTGVYWQHLTGNAARSPIVAERGRRDQVSIGAGLAYVWD